MTPRFLQRLCRVLMTALAGAALASVLSACGGDQDNAVSSSSPPPTETAALMRCAP